MGSIYIEQDGGKDFNTTENSNYTRSEQDFFECYNDEMFTDTLPAIVYTALMMTVGLLGNMVVFYVYLFKWRKSTSRTFILYLAALDMVNCAITMPMEIYLMRYSFKIDQSFLCKISRYSTYVMNSSSTLILVGIATDRFKRICRPHQRPFTKVISQRICISAIVMSLGTTWPSLFLYGSRKVNLGVACLLENQYDNTPYPMILFCYMVTTTLFVFAVITIVCYFVWAQIYRHRIFKLRYCIRVEKVFDENSLPLESEKQNTEKTTPAVSSRNPIENQNETLRNEIDIENNKEAQSDNSEDIQAQRHQTTPLSCIDIETSCDLLNIPNNNVYEHFFDNKELEVIFKNDEASEDKATLENSYQIVQHSSGRHKISVQNGNKMVRYRLVRGSSTLDGYSGKQCINCLTVTIRRSTLMLFLISIAYVMSFIPFYIIVIMRQTDTELAYRLPRSGRMAYHVLLRSYLLSSAINPFIYSFCNAQFRGYCRDALARVLWRSKQ